MIPPDLHSYMHADVTFHTQGSLFLATLHGNYKFFRKVFEAVFLHGYIMNGLNQGPSINN
jgi:hypothetical protein